MTQGKYTSGPFHCSSHLCELRANVLIFPSLSLFLNNNLAPPSVVLHLFLFHHSHCNGPFGLFVFLWLHYFIWYVFIIHITENMAQVIFIFNLLKRKYHQFHIPAQVLHCQVDVIFQNTLALVHFFDGWEMYSAVDMYHQFHVMKNKKK